MKIGILTIATGKYDKFVKPLYESIIKNFLPSHKKLFILFTDAPDNLKNQLSDLNIDLEVFRIERKGFPGDTLYRYHHFCSAKERLQALGKDRPDVLYYLDADMLIVDNVGEEVLPTHHKTIIATAHPGFYNRPGHNPLGTPESNSASTAFIPNDRYRPCYWAGGFNGGNFESFMTLSAKIAAKIDKDDSNSILAIWHDESHLNCHLSSEEFLKHVKTLTPSYCYPENWQLPFQRKIIALDKNHKEIRTI